MPICPSPCSGNCDHHCVCVILGSEHSCKDVHSVAEIMSLLGGADEIRIGSDNGLLGELKQHIQSESSLVLNEIREANTYSIRQS